MDYKKKRNLLLGLIILLILINLSAIVTFSYNKYFKKEQKSDLIVNDDKKGQNRHERIKKYVKNELKLNDNQFETYCRLKDENMDRVKLMVQKIDGYKKETLLEINKEFPDTVRLSVLADSIGYQNKLIQMEMNRHFIEIMSFLSTEQKQRFGKLLIEMDTRQKERKRWRHRHGNSHSSEKKKSSYLDERAGKSCSPYVCPIYSSF